MKYATSQEGINATDIANSYLAGDTNYTDALRALQDSAKMTAKEAMQFLRNVVAGE